MKRPRKYGPGEPILTFDELASMSRKAREDRRDAFVWEVFRYGNKPGRVVHVDWIVNTSALRLHSSLLAGDICRAVITDEYKLWLLHESAECKASAQ